MFRKTFEITFQQKKAVNRGEIPISLTIYSPGKSLCCNKINTRGSTGSD